MKGYESRLDDLESRLPPEEDGEEDGEEDEGDFWRYSVPWELEEVLREVIEVEAEYGVGPPVEDPAEEARAIVDADIREHPEEFVIPDRGRFPPPDEQTRQHYERVLATAESVNRD